MVVTRQLIETSVQLEHVPRVRFNFNCFLIWLISGGLDTLWLRIRALGPFGTLFRLGPGPHLIPVGVPFGPVSQFLRKASVWAHAYFAETFDKFQTLARLQSLDGSTKAAKNKNVCGLPPIGGQIWPDMSKHIGNKYQILAKVQFLQIEHVPQIQKCNLSAGKTSPARCPKDRTYFC